MTAQSEAMQTASRNGEGPVRLAAFDFDGTSIQGNSPVLLVRYLRGDDLLRKPSLWSQLSGLFR